MNNQISSQGEAEQNPSEQSVSSPLAALQRFMTVETDHGAEVWPNEAGSNLTAIFTRPSDAEAFVLYTSKSDADRIQNAALEIARAFPDLNYSGQPINPKSELVQRIARIILADFPLVTANDGTTTAGQNSPASQTEPDGKE